MNSDPHRSREAAKLGDARMVKTLLDAGARPEGANQDGQTALMLAIKTGELPVVEMLIKAGANVNAMEKFHNQTPLMWAAAAPKNGGEMVKLLLSKDADVKPRALYSDWPSQITSEPRAQYRPAGGLTALLYAARNGCYDCVEALIGAGADVNLPTPEGVTPLMIALDNDHNDVAKLLLDRGAESEPLGLVGTHRALHRHRPEGRRQQRRLAARAAAIAADRDRKARLPRHAAALRGGPPRSPPWTSSTPCWPRVSIPIRSSICIAPAEEETADASSTRFTIPDARLCCAPPWPTTWKWCKPCWQRALRRTSTGWA